MQKPTSQQFSVIEINFNEAKIQRTLPMDGEYMIADMKFYNDHMYLLVNGFDSIEGDAKLFIYRLQDLQKKQLIFLVNITPIFLSKAGIYIFFNLRV